MGAGVVTPMGGAGVGGLVRFSTAPASSGELHSVGERPWKRIAPQCLVCRYEGFVNWRLHEEECRSSWAPLGDLVGIDYVYFQDVTTTQWPLSATTYPESLYRRVQWQMYSSRRRYTKLWRIRGIGAGEAAETSETHVLQDTKVGLNQRVIPKYLIGKSYLDLEKIVYSSGGQKYRAKQMHQLIYKNRVKNFQECAQIPKQLRDTMESAGWRIGRSPIHHITISIDGTVKILLRLEDGLLVEAVGVAVKDRGRASSLTVCVSSQVGCALKCSFCATGKGGFGRNLKSHEIVDQVLAMEDLFKQPVTNVEFMGMGEPLRNLGAVLDAHRTLNKELKIDQQMIAISTVGVPNTIRCLASHKLHSKLVVSLHAPNQELRSEIVPSAKRYPLAALMEDCKFYFETTRHHPSFEYILLAGVNDQGEHAEELANLLRHWNFSHVNLTPYNRIADSDFDRPTKAKVLAFVETLAKRRVIASVQLTRGLDVNAACGQLRNKYQKIPLQLPIT